LASTIDLSGYYAAFPDRDFFEEGHIRELLAATNYARTFESVSPHLRDILLLACSANAVRSSNMTRRADLRRRRPDEYKERIVDVTQFIVDTLQRFREDVAQLPVKMALMNRASDDARDLPPQFNNSFDFVLTSPPYLNGTNYFRNTKIELWLLNFIETENELANFRKRAICAGINNVSRSNITKHSFDRVEEVVAQLNATEGDSRIALLVRQYFSDMCETFSAVLRSLTPGGVFLLDIGDSKFYGVHVPTDHLLVDAACYAGLKLKHRHVLARRHSRDKTELTQVELVFEKPLRNTTISAHVRCSVDNLEKRISEFQEELPYKTPPYDKRNWGHTLHSLCCYQGKLKPSMAYWLVKYFVPKHGRVLDPLGGVGTISFEAALQGHESVSNDKSPFASIVARAKLSPPSLDEARETLQALWSEIESVPDSDIDYTSVGFGLNGTVRDFYHPDTLIEILKARKLFLSRPPRSNNEAFIWACLLHVLHGNRPYALSRTSHPITPFHPKGPAIYKSVRDKIFQRASNALDTKLPATFLPGKGINGDFRNLDPKELGYFDAIITSPPFMGMRFDRPNWLRLWFCGWGEHDFHKTSLDFLERQQTKSTDCYKDFFATTRRLISDAGILILHMGSGKDDKLLEDLRRLSNDQFVFRGEVRENVLSVAQHGIRDKGMTTQHHLMFLTPR
jgi:tRNA G10  N-methylase Trm11